MKDLPYRSDLPYPELGELVPDERLARLLMDAYAGAHSELFAVLQYSYQHFVLDDAGSEYAGLLMKIAVTEMHHLDLLAGALLKMGKLPVYADGRGKFFTARVSPNTDFCSFILEDVNAEYAAIEEYEYILSVSDQPSLNALIERIIEDERVHIHTLNTILLDNCQPSIEV